MLTKSFRLKRSLNVPISQSFRDTSVIAQKFLIERQQNAGRKRSREEIENQNDIALEETPKKQRKQTIPNAQVKRPRRSAFTPNYKNLDGHSMLWESFNTEVKGNRYVSPSNIGYQILNDPFCTWNKIYKHISYERIKTFNKGLDIEESIKLENDELNVLFKKGNEFEQKVYDKIIETHGTECVTYITKAPVYNIESARLHQDKLTNEIIKGTPFIFQAPLINDENKTWGTADILVRGDYLDSLQTNVIDEVSDSELNIKINGHPIYYVVDIKWSILPLRSNANTLRNNDRFPVNKAQVTIYNAALGLLQGYTPEKAFLLGKGWKREKSKMKTFGFSPFEILGVVDFVSVDKDCIDITRKAIEDYHIIAEKGKDWDIKDLNNKYMNPNMKNSYDAPFHAIKKHVAEIRKEPTCIPLIGVKNREIGREHGILKYDDPKASAKTFGFKEGTLSFNTVNNHIIVNRDNYEIVPQIISNNHKNWMTENKNDIFVDFETMNEIFDEEKSINIKDSKSNEWTYLIGVAWLENEKINYEKFKLKSRSYENELELFREFYTFIRNLTNTLKNKYGGKSRPNIYHWGAAEMSILTKTLLKKHHNEKLFRKFTENFEWIDFLKVIKTKESPLAIKGAFGFGLKNVTNSLNNLGKISQTWPSSRIMSGKSALIAGTKYYNYLENKKENIPQMESLMSEIIEYNKIDCVAMYEVINYLRSNHI